MLLSDSLKTNLGYSAAERKSLPQEFLDIRNTTYQSTDKIQNGLQKMAFYSKFSLKCCL